MIELFLGLSLAFIMFSLGLSLEPRDFAVALRQPKALLAGLLCQVIGFPVIAFLLIRLFQLQGDLAFGVMILSCCPGGITTNVMSRWARGDVALSISYTAIVSLLTAITLPLILGASAGQFLETADIQFAVAPLSLKAFAIATLPVLIGVVIRCGDQTAALLCGQPVGTELFPFGQPVVCADLACHTDQPMGRVHRPAGAAWSDLDQPQCADAAAWMHAWPVAGFAQVSSDDPGH